MFLVKALYCRIFQGVFRLALPVLPYREPVTIHSCNDLDTIFSKEDINRMLIVTDKGIKANGLLASLENNLAKINIEYKIYDKTQPNPTVQNVEEAFDIYTKNRCNGLIAIGGGSPIDCAKAVGARVAYPKKSLQKLKGILKIKRKIPALIAIPTTAGTGSETTLAAVIKSDVKKHKYSLMSFPLIPRYAVLDAELTYSLPPQLTATTGMDALTHAVEAYIGRSTTKYTRQLSIEAVKLIFNNILTAYSNGTNHKARENMLIASYKAGLAFTRSYVGNIHALAHALGGQYNTPHGLANASIMPHVLEYYGDRVHKKLFELGIAAGVCNTKDSTSEGAKKFIESIKTLNRQMNIPEKLQGIKEIDIPRMAAYAEKEANPLYPVPEMFTKKEFEALFYKIADWSKPE